MFDLSGKTALVTGSTQGIGFEIAKCLSDHGAKVFVSGATSIEKCIDACKRIPNSTPIKANLLKLEDIERLYEQTGDVDILVLNASVQYNRKWDEYSIDDIDDMMSCNVKASYLLINKYSKGMMARGWGRIVTVGSVNQYNQHPELTVYSATKCAQFKLVQNIAPHLAPCGVTINNVSPGAISTPRNAGVLGDAEKRQIVESKIPCRFVGEPRDISPAVLLLCSEEGRYITGTDILIDGGMSL